MRGTAQILIQRTGHAFLHHIDGPGDRIGCDGEATGHGLQIHQPKGVGATWKHEHIARRQMCHQILAKTISGKHRIRVARLQSRPLRPVSHDQFRAAPAHLQERINVFLDGQASHIHRDGPRQIQELLRSWTEQLGVHAALPAHDIGKPPALELRLQGAGY
ncbi:MAG: hypothetical protein WDM77_04725 [Steroidobacteraceae bacterium]